jgi:hypothetical protein
MEIEMAQQMLVKLHTIQIPLAIFEFHVYRPTGGQMDFTFALWGC